MRRWVLASVLTFALGAGAVLAQGIVPVQPIGVRLSQLAALSTGLLTVTTATGAVSSIPYGTVAQVLRGDGTVGSVPGAALTGTTGSIGGGALAAGACASGTVNVTSATTSMSATASPLLNADPTNGGVLGVSISARVSSAGVVTVLVCAPIIGTPAAATYKVIVQ